MTAIRVCIIFAAVFFFLPYGVGRLFVSCGNKLYPWILGLCTCFLFYELLYLIFHITLGRLTVMTFLWLVACIVGASVGFWRTHHLQVNALRTPNNIQSWGRWDVILFFAIIIFFLLQIFNTVFRTYYGNLDDHYYCAIATTSLSTDTVNRYSPISGLPKNAFYSKDYTLPAWPTFSASLALLTGVHPAIIYRTLLPLVETPAAYGITYLILRSFFKEPKDRKYALLALLYVEIFTVVTASRGGGESAEFWFVVNGWSGKALSASIALPLVLLFLLRVENAKDAAACRDAWLGLILASWSCCMFAATLFFLIPVELAIWGLCYLLRTKRWKDIGGFTIAAALPIAFAAFTYLL